MKEVTKARKQAQFKKKDEQFVKRSDRKENVARINRIQDHKRDLLLVKIKEDEERLVRM